MKEHMTQGGTNRVNVFLTQLRGTVEFVVVVSFSYEM